MSSISIPYAASISVRPGSTPHPGMIATPASFAAESISSASSFVGSERSTAWASALMAPSIALMFNGWSRAMYATSHPFMFRASPSTSFTSWTIVLRRDGSPRSPATLLSRFSSMSTKSTWSTSLLERQSIANVGPMRPKPITATFIQHRFVFSPFYLKRVYRRACAGTII